MKNQGAVSLEEAEAEPGHPKGCERRGSETRGPWATPEEYRTPSRKEPGGSWLGTQEPWEVPKPLSKSRGGWGRWLGPVAAVLQVSGRPWGWGHSGRGPCRPTGCLHAEGGSNDRRVPKQDPRPCTPAGGAAPRERQHPHLW